MSKEPKCKDKKCKFYDKLMVKIGGVGKDIQITDKYMQIIGVRELELYQCMECKQVNLV